MPCYLFTLHAYRSWMPDRKQGYVRRDAGILPTDKQVAKAYRHRAKQEETEFTDDIQQLLIEAALESCDHQDYEPYYIATESTHIHLLVGWHGEKEWKAVRRGLRSSLTHKLNAEREKSQWLSQGGSRKRVKDRKHFDHLMNTYLPSHSGWKWNKDTGKYK